MESIGIVAAIVAAQLTTTFYLLSHFDKKFDKVMDLLLMHITNTKIHQEH